MARFAEVAACLAPPPGPAVQLATAEFMREGHYLRHLRRLKRAYAAKQDDLLAQLRPHFDAENRSEEHTSELQSLMRISYAVFCLKKNKKNARVTQTNTIH